MHGPGMLDWRCCGRRGPRTRRRGNQRCTYNVSVEETDGRKQQPVLGQVPQAAGVKQAPAAAGFAAMVFLIWMEMLLLLHSKTYETRSQPRSRSQEKINGASIKASHTIKSERGGYLAGSCSPGETTAMGTRSSNIPRQRSIPWPPGGERVCSMGFLFLIYDCLLTSAACCHSRSESFPRPSAGFRGVSATHARELGPPQAQGFPALSHLKRGRRGICSLSHPLFEEARRNPVALAKHLTAIGSSVFSAMRFWDVMLGGWCPRRLCLSLANEG
ncbi:hypothetical protein QBC40DRAFT_301302 [Triangularia verruculosa]|uniref:Uncharacterized protein n=1 Tax=Triangularia verruculosa TaxID=2587418 RepID=A0AAN7ARU5_9PEZI|nr:hypothetical protein QBC40DRAFT_301302 [Triangularia verruculosa]